MSNMFGTRERAIAHIEDCFPRLQTWSEMVAHADKEGFDVGDRGNLIRREGQTY